MSRTTAICTLEGRTLVASITGASWLAHDHALGLADALGGGKVRSESGRATYTLRGATGATLESAVRVLEAASVRVVR